MRQRIAVWGIFMLCAYFIDLPLLAAGKNYQHFKGANQNRSRDHQLLDANQIAAWISNDGVLFNDPDTGQSGLFYPRGAAADHAIIYTTGLWVLGKIKGE
ncbi:hypothetical protein L0128_12610 [candidate division KSB1 bacterium]|nr:hypothetical protein [candidate division KSB1 bacterium]